MGRSNSTPPADPSTSTPPADPSTSTPPADPSTSTPPADPEAARTPEDEQAFADELQAAAPKVRYAVFNETYAKYVGGVRDTKEEAEEIAAKHLEAGDTVTIRTV